MYKLRRRCATIDKPVDFEFEKNYIHFIEMCKILSISFIQSFPYMGDRRKIMRIMPIKNKNIRFRSTVSITLLLATSNRIFYIKYTYICVISRLSSSLLSTDRWTVIALLTRNQKRSGIYMVSSNEYFNMLRIKW